MSGFPLTKKRFLSLAPRIQHKFISEWLKNCYCLVLKKGENEVPYYWKLILEYRQVLLWMDLSFNPESVISYENFFSDRFHYHQNLSGKKLKEEYFLRKKTDSDRIDTSPWKEKFEWTVALDQVRSAFNVGSILRSVDSAGWKGVVLGGTTPGIENSRTKKAAMGSQNWIPVEPVSHLSSFLQGETQKIIGIETVEEASLYYEFDWGEKGIVVLGNEEYGISKEVLRNCDAYVRIPQFGRKNSLNIANAFAIIAFYISTKLTS